MESTFTLSIDWLAFTVLASRLQEAMKVLGGDWNRAKGGFRGYPLSWIRSDGGHGVGKLGTNAPRRPNEIHVDLTAVAFATKDWFLDVVCCDAALYGRVRRPVLAPPYLLPGAASVRQHRRGH